MITSFLVTNHSNDMNLPHDAADEARKNLCAEDIQACFHAGILPDCYQNTNLRVELQFQSV